MERPVEAVTGATRGIDKPSLRAAWPLRPVGYSQSLRPSPLPQSPKLPRLRRSQSLAQGLLAHSLSLQLMKVNGTCQCQNLKMYKQFLSTQQVPPCPSQGKA